MTLMSSDNHADFVLRTAEERGVRYVRLWFVDVLGSLKSIAIPVSELESALEDGVSIDGSALEGTVRLRERDVVAHPDPQTFQMLPWRPGTQVARMHCDVRHISGAPFPGDSRDALRRALGYAANLGYTLQVGAEVEFFLFGEPASADDPPVLLDSGHYLDLTPQDIGSDFRRTAMEWLEGVGIPVKASHHEVGPSQHEIDLHHTDALSMADALVTFRVVIREAARRLGMFATFMPKPLDECSGSGMHVHLSLFADDQNLFVPADGETLSPLGRAFLAGVLAHAQEFSAVSNQWVNSYKRLATGFEAPQHVSWTRNGHSALVRVPTPRPGRESGTRLELRSPDPACNPYLLFALVLAAGLRGVERGYQLPSEAADGPPPGATRLPEDLREAAELMDRSELVRETLGDQLTDWIVANKRGEWDEYRRTVTEWERRRFLRLL